MDINANPVEVSDAVVCDEPPYIVAPVESKILPVVEFTIVLKPPEFTIDLLLALCCTLTSLAVIITALAVVPVAPPSVQVFPSSCAFTSLPFLNTRDESPIKICSEPRVPIVTSFVKNALSVNNPKPGDEPTAPVDNPDKSPSLTFKSISYTPVPCLSIISIYGVVVSLGFAFSLMYPVFILPVDTNTCPG